VPPDRAWALGAVPAPADDDQTVWLVTFSDLVLQLFAFVLVALVLGNAHRPAPAPPPPPRAPEQALALPIVPAPLPAPPPRPEPVAAPTTTPPGDATAARRAAALEGSLHELARAAGPADAVAVGVHDADVVLTLSDTITFPSGSADLLPGAVPILGAIRALVGSLPDFAVQVEGHTDDVQIHTAAFPSNLELSLARAARVARELTAGDAGLVARTAATGFGEHHPVASNADEAGRARNRRVEIRLVRRDGAAG
jgi:chemotaxis protein MotB